MDDLINAAFGVTAKTGIEIDGQELTENRTVYLNINPCHIDAVIEELETHYDNVTVVGEIDTIRDMCKVQLLRDTQS